jgi:hypothetical protein
VRDRSGALTKEDKYDVFLVMICMHACVRACIYAHRQSTGRGIEALVCYQQRDS